MTGQARRRDLALLPLGFIAWAVGFSALYGLHGLGCALGWHRIALGPASLLRVLLVALFLASLAAAAAIAGHAIRRAARDRAMLPLATAGSAAAALAAMALTGAPAVALRLCQ